MHNQPPFRRPLSVLTAFLLFPCFFDFRSALPVLRKLFLGGQTAPKTGMTLHSKNKMAPHPIKKQRQGTVFPWCCFFIRSKPGLYKPHPETPYSSSFIWVYSPSSSPSFFSIAQRTAHSLWKINRLCSRRSCTHRVPSAKRRSEMGQGECLTQ